MTQKPILDVRFLDTAEELFAELSPVTGEIWGRTEGTGWIFRGQSNHANGEVWRLAPSAFRPGAFLKYEFAAVNDTPAADGAAQRQRELAAAMQFADRVDAEGLVVPGDSHEIRDFRRERPRADHREFPPAPLTAIFALAQHHGVPTRLLDWTWKPLVATYFAAEAVARRRVPGKKPEEHADARFSVFALQRSIFGLRRVLDPMIVPIHVPSATNANLHAQGGMFTLIQPHETDTHPLPDLLHALLANEATLRAELGDQFPCLIEYRVPAREARTTMRLLSNMGVTAASVFPGLSGVAKSLEEPRFYQSARAGERS